MEVGEVIRLLRLPTAEGAWIDAALTEPVVPTRVAVVHVHGKGGNFYSGPGRFLPRLMPASMAHLSINMRCHDLGYTRYDEPISGDTGHHPVGGGMWESISAGHADIAAAVRWCREQGFDRVHLVGHSSGGFYVGEYTSHDPDVAGRIFLSPLQDNRYVLSRWFPDGERERAIRAARAMVVQGRGQQLIPLDPWYHAISAASLVERAAQPDGMWERGVEASHAAALFLWGSAEGRAQIWQEIFERFRGFPKQRHVLEGADHFYHGYEDEIAAHISRFVEDIEAAFVPEATHGSEME